MRNLILAAVFLSALGIARADTKLSQLPLGSAAACTLTDSLPYVNSSTDTTQRLTLFDLINLPAFSTFARTNQSNLFTAGPQSLGTQVLSVQLPNDTVTGTTVNKLAKLTSGGKVIITATTDTNGVIGIVAAGAGIVGSADIAQVGQIACAFDNGTTAGDYVQISSITAGDCHDSGLAPPSQPTSGQVIGQVRSTNASAGNYLVSLFMPSVSGSGSGGSVSSVNVSVPTGLSVSGVPITGSGTAAISWSGTIPSTSLPFPGATTLGGTESLVCGAHNWLNQISTLGAPACSQPTYADLSGSVPAITALTGDVTATGPGSSVATIASNVVTNAKLAQMAAHTYKGNNTGATANAIDVTNTQLTADLNLFSATLQGLVPASGGGTTNFLRADGSWAAVSSPLTFADSLVNTAGTVTLVNDTATPGASKYYGTNGSSTLGYFALPTGFTNPMTTLGDLMYEDATPTAARLAGNTTTTKKYLAQTGTGTVSAAPVWSQPAFSELSGSATSAQLPVDVAYIDVAQTFTGNQTFQNNIVNQSAVEYQIANNATTATSLHRLAKFASDGTATAATTTDTIGIIGVVDLNAGTTGSANVAFSGAVICTFDGATTAGDYVIPSSTIGGDCHDNGSTLPVGQLVGRVLTTHGAGGNYAIWLDPMPGEYGIWQVKQGGTGLATIAAHSVLLGEGTLSLAVATPGAAGVPLVSTGASTDPSFGTATVPGGGTGQTTFPSGSLLTGAGTSAVTNIAAGTAQNIVRDTGSAFVSDAPETINFLQNAGAEIAALNIPTAFSDGGTTIPVNLSGGVPNTTCARTTSGPLDGAGSFLMTINSGASRQGEGCAWTITIPAAYQVANGLTLSVYFPFATTGTLLSTDVQVWAYDVTNSSLIYPTWVSPIVGSSGIAIAQFPIRSNTASVRVANYIARTTTGAATIEYDDVRIAPLGNQVTGVQATDSVAYTPVASASWGTTTSLGGQYSTVADKGNLSINVTMGTGTPAAGTISLPPGWVIDTTKLTFTNASTAIVGSYGSDSTTPSGGSILALSSDTTHVYIGGGFSGGSGSGSDRTVNMNSFAATSAFTINVMNLPLIGKSSQQNIVTAQSFNISTYLASGTRVTGSAPTSLGQYRSYLRNAGANTFTETGGTPTNPPTVASGVRLDSVSTFASGDPSGSPSKYDIYVGQNKSILLNWWSSTGKTGSAIVSPFTNGSIDVGVGYWYDAAAGVVTVQQYSLGDTTMHSGSTQGAGFINTVYFDIQVSPTALAFGPTKQNVVGAYVTSALSVTNTSFACASGGPTVSVTPNKNGIFKVSGGIVQNNGTTSQGIYSKIGISSGVGAVELNNQAFENTGVLPVPLYSLWQLVQGQTYTFCINTRVSAGNGNIFCDVSDMPNGCSLVVEDMN